MPRFSARTASAIDAIKYMYIRCGGEHRPVPIWVVDGRVLVRSWNDKPTGWDRAFRAEPHGAIRVGNNEIPIRAVPVRSAKLK